MNFTKNLAGKGFYTLCGITLIVLSIPYGIVAGLVFAPARAACTSVFRHHLPEHTVRNLSLLTFFGFLTTVLTMKTVGHITHALMIAYGLIFSLALLAIATAIESVNDRRLRKGLIPFHISKKGWVAISFAVAIVVIGGLWGYRVCESRLNALIGH